MDRWTNGLTCTCLHVCVCMQAMENLQTDEAEVVVWKPLVIHQSMVEDGHVEFIDEFDLEEILEEEYYATISGTY